MEPLQRFARMALVVVGQQPSLDDRAWEARLGEYGADRLSARRLVIFAPTAAARVYFRDGDLDVTFPATYGTRSAAGEVTQGRALTGEPAFVACLEASEWATAHQVRSVASRSGVYKAAGVLRKENPKMKRLQAGSMLIPLEHLEARGASELPGTARRVRKLQLWWYTR